MRLRVNLSSKPFYFVGTAPTRVILGHVCVAPAAILSVLPSGDTPELCLQFVSSYLRANTACPTITPLMLMSTLYVPTPNEAASRL